MNNKSQNNVLDLTIAQINKSYPDLSSMAFSGGSFHIKAHPANIKFFAQALAHAKHGGWMLRGVPFAPAVFQEGAACFIGSKKFESQLQVEYTPTEKGLIWTAFEYLDDSDDWQIDEHVEAARKICAWYSKEGKNRYGRRYGLYSTYVINKWAFLGMILSGYTFHLDLYPWQDRKTVMAYITDQYREELMYWSGFATKKAQPKDKAIENIAGCNWVVVKQDGIIQEWLCVETRKVVVINKHFAVYDGVKLPTHGKDIRDVVENNADIIMGESA